jgi:hypothetical protein
VSFTEAVLIIAVAHHGRECQTAFKRRGILHRRDLNANPPRPQRDLNQVIGPDAVPSGEPIRMLHNEHACAVFPSQPFRVTLCSSKLSAPAALIGRDTLLVKLLENSPAFPLCERATLRKLGRD